MNDRIQYPSEYRTVRYSNGHFSDTFFVRFSNSRQDRFGMNEIFFMTLISKMVYASPNHSKSGFVSGFRMVAAILFLPFEIRTRYFLTSLDRFGMNKILFMALINKTVYASNRTRMSGFRTVRYLDVRDRHKIQSEYRFGIRWGTVCYMYYTVKLRYPDFDIRKTSIYGLKFV